MLLLTAVDVLQKIEALSGPAFVFLERTYYLSTLISYVKIIAFFL
jgi:LPS sulfotransferase NodH